MPVQTDSSDGSGLQTAGWITITVGGAALIGGFTAFAIGKGLESDLEAACTSGMCDQAEQSDVDTYDTLKTLSTLGYVVGGLGLAGGVTMLLLARDAPENSAAVTPWIGATGAGVTGRF